MAEKNKRPRQRDLKRNRRFNSEQEEDAKEEEKSPLETMPSLVAYMGYALCPGTCVFGPWVKYEDYLKLFSMPRWVGVMFFLSFKIILLQSHCNIY